MPDVAVFGDVCGGCIVLVGTDQPVHWIAFAEVGIRASAKLAVASCTNVLQRSEMKTFHEGLLVDYHVTVHVRKFFRKMSALFPNMMAKKTQMYCARGRRRQAL